MQQLAILLTAVLVVSATVVVHAFGTYWLIQFLSRKFADSSGYFKRSKATLAVVVSATMLLLLHVVEIQIWAVTYLLIEPYEELTSFEAATYFSFVTFTTLGYGDITLAREAWRILSGVEALNGIMLAGWSTALLFAVVQRGWRGFGNDEPGQRIRTSNASRADVD